MVVVDFSGTVDSACDFSEAPVAERCGCSRGYSSHMMVLSKPPVTAQMCGAELVCITRYTHAGVFLQRSSGGTSVLAGERMAFSRNSLSFILRLRLLVGWEGNESGNHKEL